MERILEAMDVRQMSINNRPTWNQYALDLAIIAAKRSEDPWLKVGAVVLRTDMSIAGIGYNGAPSGVNINWNERENRRPLVIHAEVNALRYTTPAEVRGGLIAITGIPCPSCLTVISSYGIKSIVYGEELENYPTKISHDVADKLGIIMIREQKNV